MYFPWAQLINHPDSGVFPRFLCISLPGGVIGPKTDGGVPLAAETWTQKDWGKNEIWGLKDRIL